MTRAEWYSLILRAWSRTAPDGWERPRFPGRQTKRWAWREVVLRDGHLCAHCGATQGLVLDHVEPWSQGGVSHPGNLQLLCVPCNEKKADT